MSRIIFLHHFKDILLIVKHLPLIPQVHIDFNNHLAFIHSLAKTLTHLNILGHGIVLVIQMQVVVAAVTVIYDTSSCINLSSPKIWNHLQIQAFHTPYYAFKSNPKIILWGTLYKRNRANGQNVKTCIQKTIINKRENGVVHGDMLK